MWPSVHKLLHALTCHLLLFQYCHLTCGPALRIANSSMHAPHCRHCKAKAVCQPDYPLSGSLYCTRAESTASTHQQKLCLPSLPLMAQPHSKIFKGPRC